MGNQIIWNGSRKQNRNSRHSVFYSSATPVICMFLMLLTLPATSGYSRNRLSIIQKSPQERYRQARKAVQLQIQDLQRQQRALEAHKTEKVINSREKYSISGYGTLTGKAANWMAGTPLGEILIEALGISDTLAYRFSFTGEDGRYSIIHLETGTYRVRAVDLWGNHLTQYYFMAGQKSDADTVTVHSSDTTAHVDFSLYAGGEISGRIVTEHGEPIDSLLVAAVRHPVLTMSMDAFMDSLAEGRFRLTYTDRNGQYRLSGLPAGGYIVKSLAAFSHSGQYIDEFFDNAYSLKDAIPVNVTAGEETVDIDFRLGLAGWISGRIVRADDGTPVSAVRLLVFDTDKRSFLYTVFREINSLDGTFRISGLPEGRFKIRVDVDENVHGFLADEFYDGVHAFNLDAGVEIPVVPPGGIDGIDITLDTGGQIRGTVFRSNLQPVGADTMDEVQMIFYEAVSGDYVFDVPVLNDGSYWGRGLPAGDYKIAALPIAMNQSVTYYGGGQSYPDFATETVKLDPDNILILNIQLNEASGSITGQVTDLHQPVIPLNKVFIMAYDQSGHLAGTGISGVNLRTNTCTDNGEYRIDGLYSGSFFLRSWYLFGESYVNQMDLPIYNSVYMDEWYRRIPIHHDVWESTYDMMRNRFIPPFPQAIPPAAVPVIVTGGGETGSIHFELDSPARGSSPVGPSEIKPETPFLFPNWPNPFNPSTRFVYTIPQDFQRVPVRIDIFDVRGRLVKKLTREVRDAGRYEITWDGTDSSGKPSGSGLYICRFKAGITHTSRKIMLIR